MRKLIGSLFLWATSLLGQNTALPPAIHAPFLDSSGNPLAGGKLYFCVAGTICPGNPQTIYADSTGKAQQQNPVPLDSTGYATIWLGSARYKVVAQNSLGRQVWVVDNVQNHGLVTQFQLGMANGLTRLDSNAFVLHAMNYNQGGAGAANRTIPDRLQDFVSVKDFHAKGDGVTDDTAALQAALCSVGQCSIPANSLAFAYRKGGTVWFPPGKYRTTTTLYVPAFVSMRGSGRAGFIATTLSASVSPTTIIDYEPSDANTWAIQSGNFVVATGAQYTGTTNISGNNVDNGIYSEARDIGIYDLTVMTNQANVLGGVFLTAAGESHVERIGISGSFINGIKNAGSWAVRITDPLVNISGANAIGINVDQYANGIEIDHSYVTTNTTNGIGIRTGGCAGCKIINPTVEKSVTAFQTDGDNGLTIEDMYVENITSKIIAVTANGSSNLRAAGGNISLSRGAVVFDDLGGAQAAEISQIHIQTVSKMIGNFTAYTQVTFRGMSPTASDNASTFDGASAIAFYPDAKHAILYGNQFVNVVSMPSATAKYIQTPYSFGGTINYDLKILPNRWQLEDWASGEARVIYDWQNNKFQVPALQVSGGSALKRYAKFTATLSPTVVGANTCAVQSFTVTGALLGDVSMNPYPKPSYQTGLSIAGWTVSGNNNISINFCNNTAAQIMPTASEIYTFVVIQ